MAMYNNTNYFSIVVIVLMLAGGLLLTESARSRCRESAYGVIHVILHAVDRTAEFRERAGIDMKTLSAVQLELSQLREENQRLSTDREAFSALAKENDELRKKLGFKPATGFNLVPCHVIASDPSPWWNSLLINIGSINHPALAQIQATSSAVLQTKNRNQDVLDQPRNEHSFAVVSPSGVVGKTGVIGKTMMEVIALVNENCRITATLGQSKQQGVLVGEGSVREGAPRARLKFVPQGSTIEVGELVYTSGLDGVFAPGLLLGTVSEVAPPSKGALYRDVIVTPAVEVAHLENLFLIVGSP